jgi:hypothetical protein
MLLENFLESGLLLDIFVLMNILLYQNLILLIRLNILFLTLYFFQQYALLNSKDLKNKYS